MKDYVCGRCLVYLNATSTMTAMWMDGTERKTKHPGPVMHAPSRLLEWIERVMEESGGDAEFTVDDSNARVLAVTTWNGDPVCSYHIYWLVEGELRRGWGK